MQGVVVQWSTSAQYSDATLLQGAEMTTAICAAGTSASSSS